MTRSLQRAATFRTAAAILLILLVQGVSKSDPLTITWVGDSEPIMLGQPIILTFKITNVSNRAVYVDWRGENLALSNASERKLPPWLSVNVLTETGRPVPPLPQGVWPYTYAGGIQGNPVSEIAPGGVRQGSIVLSQWYALRTTGRNQVALSVELPYAEHSSPEKRVFRSDQTITLETIRPSQVRLRRLAQNLRREAVRLTQADQMIVTVDALFSIPESHGLAEWRELAFDPALGLNAAIVTMYHLGKKANSNTVALLYEIASHPNVPTETKVLAKQALYVAQVNSPAGRASMIKKMLSDLE